MSNAYINNVFCDLVANSNLYHIFDNASFNETSSREIKDSLLEFCECTKDELIYYSLQILTDYTNALLFKPLLFKGAIINRATCEEISFILPYKNQLLNTEYHEHLLVLNDLLLLALNNPRIEAHLYNQYNYKVKSNNYNAQELQDFIKLSLHELGAK